MPQILKHATTSLVVEFGLVKPLLKVDVVAQRAGMDLGPRGGELGTAWRGNHLGDVGVVKNLDPGPSECKLGRTSIQLSKRLDFGGAARFPVTAHAHIPSLVQEPELQALDGQRVALLVKLDMVGMVVRM